MKKVKAYEVEIKATTFRVYEVEATSEEQAEELALERLDSDTDVSRAWREASDVNYIRRVR